MTDKECPVNFIIDFAKSIGLDIDCNTAYLIVAIFVIVIVLVLMAIT